jgi:integrase
MTTAKARARGVFWRDSRKGTQVHPETRARGDWYIRYTDQHGQLHKERVGPRALAIELYRKRKTEIREGRFFPKPIPKRVVLFDEIAKEFLVYSREHKRSAENDEARMRRLLGSLGGRPVSDINSHDVEQLGVELRRDLSPASVNRHLALLKVTFNRAMKAEPAKAERNPVRGVKLLKENKARVRVLTDTEEERLLAALPLCYRPLVIVALHTGMRRGELANLRWQDVDFHTRTLVVRESKSGEGRRMPMNRVVAATLRTLRRERQAFGGLVFTSPEGRFLHNFGRAWAKAVRAAEITDLRFRDLRHTAASRLVMAGVDLYTVKEILGHKTLVMTQRYAHLSPEHQRQAVERLVRTEPAHASATDPVTAPAASVVGGGGDVTAEKKWWTGGELNSRHRDFQFSDRVGSIRHHWTVSA